MRACVIGTGRVALGLIAETLVAAGHEVTLLGRDPAVHDRLGRAKGYRVRLGDTRGHQERWVSGVTSHLVTDAEARRALANADMVATATGLISYAPVAQLLAAALPGRRPVNVLCFENGTDVAAGLAQLVRSAAAPRWDAPMVGFAGAIVSRIVSRIDVDPDGVLVACGDSPGDITVDRGGLVADLPDAAGLVASGNFRAVTRRKLSTFSAAHGTAAYLGWLKGYRYVHAAVRDPQIRGATEAAVREGQAGLYARYGPEWAGGPGLVGEIVHRLDNAELDDRVERVAGDPLRKLGSSERLIGSAVLAEEAGVRPRTLALAAAAAISFYRAGGGTCSPEALLSRVCQVDASGTFARDVLRGYRHFERHAVSGSAMIDLDRRVWSCSALGREPIG
ncbi:MAG: hypothetical protein ACRDPT_03230 [Streptomycetales bacterium]